MSPSDSLAKASKELMLKEPFYGLFLIALNKVWEKRVPTAGVCKRDINYQLVINEEFFMGLPEKHKIGLLKHELLHIGFFHLEEENPGLDKKLVNIAMDLEINQYIDGEYLPEGGCTLDNETFAPMNLPTKVGWKAYYDLLLKEQQKQQQNGQSDTGLQQLCDGQGTDQAKTDNGDIIPQHGSWEDFEGLSDAEKKLMHSQVEHMLNEISDQIQKTRGMIPGEFAEIINKIKHKEPPRFDWKGYLRRFAGGSQIVFTKKMRRKFNKRFEDNPSLKIKQRRHVLVAIDTSGSVSTKELEEFFQEIDHINQTGSDITVIQCDASIRSIKSYKKGDQIEVHGRGGTAFDPVLEYFNENVRKYSCMVYLTDGECSTNVKVRGKMLWVISTRGNINKDLEGPQIKLN